MVREMGTGGVLEGMVIGGGIITGVNEGLVWYLS